MSKEILLHKFLCRELSEEEETMFLQLLKEDEGFAKRVKIESLLHANQSIKIKEYLSTYAERPQHIHEEQNIESNSNRSVKENQNSPSTVKRMRTFSKPLINIAAVFLVGCVGYFMFQSLNKKEDLTLLDKLYNNSFDAPGIAQSEDGNKTVWNEARMYFNDENYDYAAQQISTIDSLSIEQQVFLALSNMYKKAPDFDKSINIFNTVMNHPDNLYQDVTEWYLAIAYLKINQKEKAKPLLEYISSNDHFRQDLAIEALSQFDDF